MNSSHLSIVLVSVMLVGCGRSVVESDPAPSAEAQRGVAVEISDREQRPAESQTAGERLRAALEGNQQAQATSLAFEFDETLQGGDVASEQIAAELLAVTAEVVPDEDVAAYIERVAEQDKVAAAKLLAWVVRAQVIGRLFDNAPYAVGRVVVSDGSYPAAHVMAQMPIMSEGYFATEIGDRDRPLVLRAPGYEDLEVPLDDQQEREADTDDTEADHEAAAPDGIALGDVTLNRLEESARATVRGRLALDDVSQLASSEVRLDLAMPPANTPHNGYSPRRSWPEGASVEVGDDGQFELGELNPGKYSVMAGAEEHAPVRRNIAVEPSETHDLGELALRSTNLGFYVGADEPDVPELAWEENFDAALERAKRENRPLMVMMTATWCGPCKALERDSLSNVWIRHFMAPFVVVKAYEEKAVEDRYGLRGYPTLVFCDSEGESAYKSVGYRPAIDFAAEVARALHAVDAEPPAELQTLIDKKVVVVD